jgi:hypothetical protein
MRPAGRMRLGFFPLPAVEARRIHKFLQFPNQHCSALDPCIGDGAAFSQITSGEKVLRHGIELEANRAETARVLVNDLIQGNCFDVQCPVESLSLIYLNPPYDFELSEQGSQRMERLFLEHVYRWLRPGGVLVLVVPEQRIGECSAVLSAQIRDVRVYRLTEPESVRYRQIVLFGVRWTRYERDVYPTARSPVRDVGTSSWRETQAESSRCPQNQITNTLCRPARRFVLSTVGFRSIRLRICLHGRRLTAKRHPSFSHKRRRAVDVH